MVLLQQQILNSGPSGENQLPTTLHGRLPASSLEELKLIDSELSDKDTKSNLVCMPVTVFSWWT